MSCFQHCLISPSPHRHFISFLFIVPLFPYANTYWFYRYILEWNNFQIQVGVRIIWEPWKLWVRGFPGGSVVKSLPTNTGEAGSTPDPGRAHVPGGAKPAGRHRWACAPGPGSRSYWSPRALEPRLGDKRSTKMSSPSSQLEASRRSPQLEQSLGSSEDAAQPK